MNGVIYAVLTIFFLIGAFYAVFGDENGSIDRDRLWTHLKWLGLTAVVFVVYQTITGWDW